MIRSGQWYCIYLSWFYLLTFKHACSDVFVLILKIKMEEYCLPNSRDQAPTMSSVQEESFAEDFITVESHSERFVSTPPKSNLAPPETLEGNFTDDFVTVENDNDKGERRSVLGMRRSVILLMRNSNYLSSIFGPGKLHTTELGGGTKTEEEGQAQMSCLKSMMTRNILCVQKYPHLTMTITVTVLGWVAFLVLGSLGWPGETSRKNCFENYLWSSECFCEHPRPGRIFAQPANTISNFIYNVAALFLAWCADTHKFPNNEWWESHVNMLTQEKWFSLGFCVFVTNTGYSSGMMHGGWNRWGDKLDSVSIIVLIIWIEMFSICKFYLMFVGWTPERLRLATKWHAGLFLILGSALYIYEFVRENNATRVNILFETVGISVLLEISIRFTYAYCKGNERYSNLNLGWVGVFMIGVGYFIQKTTQSGSDWCWPNSWFQGHAVWHVFSGLGLIPIYFFFLSEKFTMKRREGEVAPEELAVGITELYEGANVTRRPNLRSVEEDKYSA